MQQLFIYCHVSSEKDLVIVPAKVCVRLEICMCTHNNGYAFVINLLLGTVGMYLLLDDSGYAFVIR